MLLNIERGMQKSERKSESLYLEIPHLLRHLILQKKRKEEKLVNFIARKINFRSFSPDQKIQFCKVFGSIKNSSLNIPILWLHFHPFIQADDRKLLKEITFIKLTECSSIHNAVTKFPFHLEKVQFIYMGIYLLPA